MWPFLVLQLVKFMRIMKSKRSYEARKCQIEKYSCLPQVSSRTKLFKLIIHTKQTEIWTGTKEEIAIPHFQRHRWSGKQAFQKNSLELVFDAMKDINQNECKLPGQLTRISSNFNSLIQSDTLNWPCGPDQISVL